MLQSASLTRQQRNDARHMQFELNPGLFGVVLCKMSISYSVLEYHTVQLSTHALNLPRSTHLLSKSYLIQLYILINTRSFNCYSH